MDPFVIFAIGYSAGLASGMAVMKLFKARPMDELDTLTTTLDAEPPKRTSVTPFERGDDIKSPRLKGLPR